MAGVYFKGVLQYLRRTVRPPVTGEATDRELLARFAAGREETAFATLVQRHAAMVLSVCRRVLRNDHDAEEAFQAAFLVLATKAAAIGWHESVAGWLHAVAFRAASNLRAGAVRRRHHERQAVPMDTVDSPADLETQDLRRVLDEELSHLPEKYRAPLVLCYLEGKTNEEAATQLGWTKGTVSGRLAQARDLLRGRLTRRGVALSAAAFPAVLTESASAGTVPTILMKSTIKAALLIPASHAAAAGAVSAPAAALAQGVMRTMLIAKIKIAAAVLLAVGLLATGAGVVTYRSLARGPETVAVALTPLPAAEAKDAKPGPRASEPVVQKGLSVSIRPDKAVFGVGEPLGFTLIFKNVSEKGFYLYDLDWVKADGLTITGNGRWATQRRKAQRPEVSHSKAIFPGGTLEVKLTADDLLRLEFADSSDGPPPPRPGQIAGKYRTTAAFKFTDYPFAESTLEVQFLFPHWIGEITTNPAEFEIAGPAVSRPVRVNGVDFEVVADAIWTVPAPGEHTDIQLGLRITNRSDKELVFNLFDTLAPRLTGADGKELAYQFARDKTKPVPPLRLAAGRSETVSRPGRLEWDKDGNRLLLSGIDPSGGLWSIRNIRPGKYTVRFHYENAGQNDFWVGKVQTEPVAVDVRAADKAEEKREEKPRFKGVELYSWKDPKLGWTFALLTGTNRVKTEDEVKAAQNQIAGVENLKKALARLAVNEEVFWSHLIAGFEYPPKEMRDEIAKAAADSTVKLTAPPK